jgi:hypothetical protein
MADLPDRIEQLEARVAQLETRELRRILVRKLLEAACDQNAPRLVRLLRMQERLATLP